MNELLGEVTRLHHPHPPATPAELAAFEAREGWKLDPDLRAFYLHCNGAVLFPNDGYGPPYQFQSLTKLVRARIAIFDEDSDKWAPPHFYALCYLLDGDWVVLDTSRQEDGRYPLIDAPKLCFYEPKYCTQIASSFAEFLDRALRSEGRLYWLPDSSDDE